MHLARKHLALAALAAAALAAGGTGAAIALAPAPDTLTVVSRANGLPGAVADGVSEIWRDAVSADGRYIVFTSNADGLVTGDNDGQLDAFVRDLETGTVKLVSREDGATGAHGPEPVGETVISDNGNLVAFSTTGGLGEGDNNADFDVYVRDLVNDTTELVSRPDGSTTTLGDDQSRAPSISADGTRIAFWSTADNLDTVSDDFPADVFVRDTTDDSTELVSRANGVNGAAQTGHADEHSVGISADGSHVAFATVALNLRPPGPGGPDQVYVRNVDTGTTTHVSRTPGGAMGDGSAQEPAISADGRYVAFMSGSTNLDPATPTESVDNIFVRDVQGNTTVLASRATGATGAPSSSGGQYASISNDGRYVAFDSSDDDLSGGITNERSVYVRDLVAKTTGLVSRGPGVDGAIADGPSGEPSMLPNGDGIAFESEATNLSDLDELGWKQIFLRGKVTIAGGPGPVDPSPLPPGGGQQPVDEAPNCSAVKLARKRFRPVKKGRKGGGGTVLRCTASEAATLTLTFLKKRRGKFRRLGKLGFKLKAGRNSIKLSGRLKGRALKPGTYRLRLELEDAAGQADPSPAVVKATVRR